MRPNIRSPLALTPRWRRNSPRAAGARLDPNSGAYALASADLFFTAGIAQNTLFFADIVGLSGAPPDTEIPSLTLINGYTARLVEQNSLNLREAWLRTESPQRLAITAGRLDLTNYFDANAFANDESTQFISDALVNNQMLGLAATESAWRPNSMRRTASASSLDFSRAIPNRPVLAIRSSRCPRWATRLHPSHYLKGPIACGSGPTIRADVIRKGFGLSFDQKLSPAVGLFARYGQPETDLGHDRFYSAGVSFQNGFIFNPEDTWGVGYANMTLASGEKEHLIEGYYNLLLTEKLRLSFHLTSARYAGGGDRFGYIFPGIRFQAAF